MSSDGSDDTLSPGRFIKELWGIAPREWHGEFFLIRYKPTQKDPDAKDTPVIFWSIGQVLDDWPSIEAALQHQNRTKVFNIHPCVNPRFRRPKRVGKRGKNSDVSHYVALWIDVDFHGNETEIRKRFLETCKIFSEAGIPPSIVVESGHGLHAYWLLDKPYPSDKARPCCAGVQDTFKISDAVHDPSRVLRMPGTVNLKDAKHPAECRVVEATYRRYPLEAFSEYALEPGKSREDLEEEDVEKQIKSGRPSKDPKIERWKTEGVDEGERHEAAKAVAGNYASDHKIKSIEAVLAKMHIWNKAKCRPPIADEQIEGLSKYAWENEEKKRAQKKPKREESEFFDGKKFLPNVLAAHVCVGKNIIATPIGDKYKGVYPYIYSDGVFRRDRNGDIEKQSRETLARDATPKHIDDTIDMVLRNKKIPYDQLNRSARNLINVKNGMLDWKEGKLIPHDPKYLSTIQINAEYHPDAVCQELDRFLADVFPPDCLALSEEFIGYLLTPDTSFQKAFIAVGPGGNGKGTFLKIINVLLGDENVSTVDLHSLENDKFARSLTLGKLANIHHDISRDDLESTSVFKTITSGDPITMEEKHKQGFTARPYARLVFSANEFPKSKDKTNAFFRRLIFVEFQRMFFGSKEEILEYEKKLCSIPEFLPALLNRAIQGLKRLHAHRRFTASATSTEVEEKYRREVDSAYDFFKECCSIEEWGWIPRRELFDKYHGWCQDEGIQPMGSRNFTTSFRKLNGVKEIKREGTRGWAGVSWLNGTAPATTKDAIRELGNSAEPTLF